MAYSSDITLRNVSWTDLPLFWSRWLKRPAGMGAIAPSGRPLARAMLAQIPPEALASTDSIVELGGGTGAITAAFAASGVDPRRLVVVERDPVLAARLRERFPVARVIEGDALALPEILAPLRVRRAAAVVSGLPLLLFPPDAVRRLVAACLEVLGPGRPLIQFTYGWHSPIPPQEALVARRAARVWRNLPPAAVWVYTSTPKA